MGAERFDVRLLDIARGATITREWSKAELVRSVPWLKRMNARGNNIYIRPNGEHGLALLQLLNAEKLARIRSKGFAPALILEIAGNGFQAWVKLSDRALPERLRRLAASGLANAFGGAADKAGLDGFGWLAGCTNRGGNPNTLQQGKYVLAHCGKIEIGEQARAYVEYVNKAFTRPTKKLNHTVEVDFLAVPQRTHDRSR